MNNEVMYVTYMAFRITLTRIDPTRVMLFIHHYHLKAQNISHIIVALETLIVHNKTYYKIQLLSKFRKTLQDAMTFLEVFIQSLLLSC